MFDCCFVDAVAKKRILSVEIWSIIDEDVCGTGGFCRYGG